MLKLCGAVLVVGAGSLFGIGMHRRLRARVHLLNGICNAFSTLRTEILFLQTPLQQAIGKAAAVTGNAIFSAMEEQMQNGSLPLCAMKSVLAEQTCLTEADQDVLLYAASALGNSDTFGQDSHIETVLEQLCVQKAQAQDALCASGRLYLAAGVLGGVLLVILLA